MASTTVISIHTSLAGSDSFRAGMEQSGGISIHTSLAGSDESHGNTLDCLHISIHTSLAGSDVDGAEIVFMVERISIHTSLAGSDIDILTHPSSWHHFNPHFPCGK